MSGTITPQVIVEQRRIAGDPNGKGKAKQDSYNYHVAKAQNALSPKIGQTLDEAELAQFMADNPTVRVTVNG